ncbi:TPA: class I SAM-dependent methyltransferase [Escherichia coli]|uniref:Class I SAM-dependent methyltransferase n=1 Tax=Escherichia marmotae TaxID=1499973 RepID=A0ABU1C6Q5_9ESCH|nr:MULTISPECIES: class I SAM-dependent methyltransferase [Escherichia]EFI5801447.1 class I SAM-dependent methyltransferase [Escherichia coli]EFM2327576.1 class I SAM-dependent methyltransferase [Escherichia coli]EFM3831469.1 class I SAM-dependent methyltransferase [Escherichia coli]EFM9345912.1 class I SAM-dependent methyltransferase [Escherichia coli]EGL7849702.1 class I SAM-dependent methyltransferase [Escherichia coli]
MLPEDFYSDSSKEVVSESSHFDPTTFDEYAELYKNILSWPYRKDLELPTLKRLMGNLSGLNVLDFGCGPGLIARWLRNMGATRIVGYDISEGMLNYARQYEEKEKLGIEYISDIKEEQHDYFDVVLAIYVIPYATTHEELQAMIYDMYRLLKPGGRLITLPFHPDFNADPEYYRPFGLRLSEIQPRADGSQIGLNLCYPPYDVNITAHYWSRQTLNNTLRQVGFQTVEWRALETPSSDTKTELLPYIQCPHAAIIECIKG